MLRPARPERFRHRIEQRLTQPHETSERPDLRFTIWSGKFCQVLYIVANKEGKLRNQRFVADSFRIWPRG